MQTIDCDSGEAQSEPCSAHPYTEPFFRNVRAWNSMPWLASSLCISSTITSDIVVKMFAGLNAVPVVVASEWRSSAQGSTEASNPSPLGSLSVWSRCCRRTAPVDNSTRGHFASGLLSAIAESFASLLHRPECCWARQGWRLLGRPRNNVLVDLVTRPVRVDDGPGGPPQQGTDSSSDWQPPIGCSAHEIQSRTEAIRTSLFHVSLSDRTCTPPPPLFGEIDRPSAASLPSLLVMLGFDEGTSARWPLVPSGDDGASQRDGPDTANCSGEVQEVPWDELPHGLRELVPRPVLVCHYCGAVPPLQPLDTDPAIATATNKEDGQVEAAVSGEDPAADEGESTTTPVAVPAPQRTEWVLCVSASSHRTTCCWRNNFLTPVMGRFAAAKNSLPSALCSAAAIPVGGRQRDWIADDSTYLHIRVDESSDTAEALLRLHRELLNRTRTRDPVLGDTAWFPMHHPSAALANHARCLSHFAVSTLPSSVDSAASDTNACLAVRLPLFAVDRALQLSSALVRQRLPQQHSQRSEGQDLFPFRRAYATFRQLLFPQKRPRSEASTVVSADDPVLEKPSAVAATQAYKVLRAEVGSATGRGDGASTLGKKTTRGAGTGEDRLLDCLRIAVRVHGTTDPLPLEDRNKVDSCVTSVVQALEGYLRQPPPAKPSVSTTSVAAAPAGGSRKSGGPAANPQRAGLPVSHHHHHHQQQHNYRNVHPTAVHAQHHNAFHPQSSHAQYHTYPQHGSDIAPPPPIFAQGAPPPPLLHHHHHHHHLMAPPSILNLASHPQQPPLMPPFAGASGAPAWASDVARQRGAAVLPADLSPILPTVAHGKPLSANAAPFQPPTQPPQPTPARSDSGKFPARPPTSPQPHSHQSGSASLLAAPSATAAPARGAHGKAMPSRGADRGGVRQPTLAVEQPRPQQPPPKHSGGKSTEASTRIVQQPQEAMHPQSFRGRGGGVRRGRSPRGQ